MATIESEESRESEEIDKNESTNKKDGDKDSKFKYISDVLKQVKERKDKVQEICRDKINVVKNRIDERRNKKKDEVPEEQPSKIGSIFITKSSIDFERIKSEGHSYDYQPNAYPIIGACIIALPYTLKEAGFPMGIFLLIFSAMMVEYSETLLINCSIMKNEICLQAIVKSLFGIPGAFVSTLLPLLYSLSVLVTYNVILCDLCTKLFDVLLHTVKNDSTTHRKFVLVLISFIILPISMTTNVKRIFKWSMISLLSASFVTVFVTVRCFTLTNDVPFTYNAFQFTNTNILQSIAMMTFAFSCQHTCRLYYTTIDQSKELNTRQQTADTATSYSLLCTLVLAISGYITFKGLTQCNIMENYCEEDNYANVARVFFAAFIFSLYPLECQSIRHLIHQNIIVHRKFEQIFNIAITTLILIPPFSLALFIECLVSVLEIAGLLFAVPLVYILPAVLYLRIAYGKIYEKKKLPCSIMLCIGIMITVFGLVVKMISPSRNCIHMSTLFPYCNGSLDLLGPLITLASLNGTANIDQSLVTLNLTELDGMNITDIKEGYSI